MAKKRFCVSATSVPNWSSIFCSVVSTCGAKLCTMAEDCPSEAALTASFAASLIPVPFNAEISTTSQPNTLDNALTLI